VKNFAADKGGATAIEYTLLAMLIAVVIITALTTIGTRVSAMIGAAATGLR
jgi:pilus assembly protein Flp/PilA